MSEKLSEHNLFLSKLGTLFNKVFTAFQIIVRNIQRNFINKIIKNLLTLKKSTK